MKVKTIEEYMRMSIGNYLQILDCEHDVAHRNETYGKDHQSGKKIFLKAYLYAHQ